MDEVKENMTPNSGGCSERQMTKQEVEVTSGHCSHKPTHKLPAVIGFLNPVKQKSPVAKFVWIAQASENS